uniref:Uncharacterized protein n=1 Tax=Anguilla anguilla TaxID=7936 RepID=A0A0E9V8U0_ANGAN
MISQGTTCNNLSGSGRYSTLCSFIFNRNVYSFRATPAGKSTDQRDGNTYVHMRSPTVMPLNRSHLPHLFGSCNQCAINTQ